MILKPVEAGVRVCACSATVLSNSNDSSNDSLEHVFDWRIEPRQVTITKHPETGEQWRLGKALCPGQVFFSLRIRLLVAFSNGLLAELNSSC